LDWEKPLNSPEEDNSSLIWVGEITKLLMISSENLNSLWAKKKRLLAVAQMSTSLSLFENLLGVFPRKFNSISSCRVIDFSFC
jgi:hypothetical protein